MRLLVSQTTRMGDMLQTSPLIRALRRRYPEATIAVMVRPLGKPMAECNPDVDEIFLYDEDAMFGNLRAKDSGRLLKAYMNADAIIQWMRDGRFDAAYNCSHSVASAMLLKLAGIGNVVGAHLSEDWRFVIRGPWANYLFASVITRDFNDLNLCDITGRFVEDAPPCHELVFEVAENDRAFAGALLAEHGVKPGEFVVCFQLGASEEAKRWAESHFAALAKLLVEERGAKIFLLGVAGEAQFGEAFERHAPGIGIPLFGKTTIAQAAALLERSALLVTNDTGTMHVAAAVGCPVVLVSIGYVHFRETGPYGAGHVAIEGRKPSIRATDVPGEDADRTLIQPAQVMGAIDAAIGLKEDGPAEWLEDAPHLADVDVYRSEFAPDGCLQWHPVIRRPMEEKDFLRLAYRLMWLEHLSAHADQAHESESLERVIACYAGAVEEGVAGWEGRLSGEFRELGQLAARGIDGTGKLLEHLTAKKSLGEAGVIVAELMKLDEEMRLFGELHQACRPLVHISRYARDNLESEDPLILAQTTLQIYRDCFDRAALMERKLARIARAWCAKASPT